MGEKKRRTGPFGGEKHGRREEGGNESEMRRPRGSQGPDDIGRVASKSKKKGGGGHRRQLARDSLAGRV